MKLADVQVKFVFVDKAMRQLNYEQAFTAGEGGVELAMLPCGHFMVKKYGHKMIFGGAQCIAQLEDDPTPTKE